MTRRWIVAGLAGAMALGLVGCGTSVTMSNESESWVDVRYYVGNPPEEAGGAWKFVARGRQQIEPGSSASYDLSENSNFDDEGESVVHALVEPTAASWEEASQYWVELLTPAPMTIMLSEGEEGLSFSTEEGVIKIVPEETVASDGYVYTTVVEFEDDEDEDDEGEDDEDGEEHEGEERPIAEK